MKPLSKELQEALQKREACTHCGWWHTGMCRRIKRWRRDANGSVEFEYRRFFSKRGYLPPEAVLSEA